jgi:hypothetical protein
MPTFSGHLKRTSGQRRLLPKIIYIAIILAAQTLIGARQDTQAAGSFSLPLWYMKNNLLPPCSLLHQTGYARHKSAS